MKEEISMEDLVILLAHGSRDPLWAKTFEKFTHNARVKYTNTTLAYMELCTPSLEQAVETGVKRGYDQISVLPLFLARGKHLRFDVPKLLNKYERKHGIKINLLAPLGEQAELATAVELFIDRHIQ